MAVLTLLPYNELTFPCNSIAEVNGKGSMEGRVVSVNVNGIYDECKRRMIIDSCMRVNVLYLAETHLLGSGSGNETGIWEGLKGLVWRGQDESYGQ